MKKTLEKFVALFFRMFVFLFHGATALFWVRSCADAAAFFRNIATVVEKISDWPTEFGKYLFASPISLVVRRIFWLWLVVAQLSPRILVSADFMTFLCVFPFSNSVNCLVQGKPYEIKWIKRHHRSWENSCCSKDAIINKVLGIGVAQRNNSVDKRIRSVVQRWTKFVDNSLGQSRVKTFPGRTSSLQVGDTFGRA